MKARNFQFIILADDLAFEGVANPTKSDHTPAEMIPTLIAGMAQKNPIIANAQKITVSVKIATPVEAGKGEEGLPA